MHKNQKMVLKNLFIFVLILTFVLMRLGTFLLEKPSLKRIKKIRLQNY